MKTLITAAAIALTTATGASAMNGTTDAELATISQFAPGADLSNLSDASVDRLIGVIHGGNSAGDIAATVKNTVRKSNG